MRAVGLLLTVGILAGCTRAQYRMRADEASYSIIAERIVFPTFDIGRTQLEPHPGSRLADPFNPDRPPKPPDDPAAALFMERPGGIRGSRRWGRDGYADFIEPPGWEILLCPDDKGIVRLDQNKAVEVALINSREYQTELEAVYLSALALTLNRFEFDMQWFLTNGTSFTHFGSGGAANGETNTLRVDTNLGYTRNLAAGGQFLTDFANSFVYEFTGDTGRWNTNWLFSLVQPVLRGAGRKVRLETLTQGERNTLYIVRAFARFRKQFWTDVAIDNGGYLDLLLGLQTIRNNQANLQRQEETYRLYYELFLGGRASAVELDQFFQSLQGARLGVISAQTSFDTALDQFKLKLGIPPQVPVELDDSLLNTFVLVDPELERLRDDLEAFQRERLAELGEPPPLDSLQHSFDRLANMAQLAPQLLARASADLNRWGSQLQNAVPSPDNPEAIERSKSTYATLVAQAPTLAADVEGVIQSIDKHRSELSADTRQAAWQTMSIDVKSLLATIDAIIAVQTQAKIHLIDLPAVNMQEEQALDEAKTNRLDLMNSLGVVTDAWRNVTVTANALRADLDVVTTASLGTDPDHFNPLNFASEASAYSVGVRFNGPLNRLAERNAYRASLITYQRARRLFMGVSDNIEFQIRRDLRNLHLLSVSFEISRQQLLSAARQYESARIILLGPRERRSANDTTTLNLLQALSALNNARNALAQNYINYEQQRVQLLLDLEALQLDPRGFPLRDSLSTDGSGNAAQPTIEEIQLPQLGPSQQPAAGTDSAERMPAPGGLPPLPGPGGLPADVLPPPGAQPPP